MKLQIYLPVILIAVAVASASNSLPVVFGLCKHHTSVVGDLEPERYFKGKWYIWKTHGGFLFDRAGSCAGMDSTMVGNDVQLLNFQYEPLLGKYLTIRGEADAAYIQNMGLPFPVNYNFGGMNFTLNFNILGTDYDNWAVVYLCRQLVGLKIEMSWLIVRDRDSILTPEQKGAISETISNVGLSIGDYEPEYNENCRTDEPHL